MKKLLSLLLALSLGVSLFGGAALAADEGVPFELTATLNSEEKTITLSLQTVDQVSFGNIDLCYFWPTNFTLVSFEKGDDYDDFNLTTPIYGTQKVNLETDDLVYGSSVEAGKELWRCTLDASRAAAGDYTFSVEFSAAADIEGESLSWEEKTIVSNSITIEDAESEPVVTTVDFRGMQYAVSSWYTPYFLTAADDYALNEMIYNKSLIATSGTIESLAFYVSKTITQPIQTDLVRIYMGTTEKSAFTRYAAAEWIPSSDLTLVYEGSPALCQEVGWETLELTTPFYYDNSENLVILIYREGTFSSLAIYAAYAVVDSDTLGASSTNFFSLKASLNGSTSSGLETSNLKAAGRNGVLPYLQLTFDAKDACTHGSVTVHGIDNGDGTHTLTKTCDICGAEFTSVTEKHDYDWVNASLEGNVYTAACRGCGAETAMDVSGKALLQVTPATRLEEGKVYVITNKDSTYAMSEESSLSTTGTPLKIRRADPVTVVQDAESQEMYIVFDSEDEKNAGQWDYLNEEDSLEPDRVEGVYLTGGYLRGHSSGYYLFISEDSGLSLPTWAAYSGMEENNQFKWSYDSDEGVLYTVSAYPREIHFSSTAFNGGSTGISGTSPFFQLGAGTYEQTNLYEVVGVHAHIWDEGVVTTEATCTEKGVKTYTCTVCGETKTEAIPATGHTWDDGVVTKEATCTEKGVKTYTCTVCGETKTEAVPATGHVWDDGVVTKEATCGEDGVRTYTCVCGVKGCCGEDGASCETKTEAIPATGEHTWDDGVVTREPTYTEEGVRTYTCAVCGATKTESIPVLEPPIEDGDLGVTVEVYQDYVGGYSLIVVYGDAEGYLYDGNAMYRAAYYDRETEDGPNAAFVYIVEGAPDSEDVPELLSKAESAAQEITASYDVNGSKSVDIADVQAVADCYNGSGDLKLYLEAYLRADVNADHVVNSTDAELVLRSRN